MFKPTFAASMIPVCMILSVSAAFAAETLSLGEQTPAPLKHNPSGSGRPNIIVILSDDMGYSDLGCYGGEIRTPHLDGLANSGIRFTQFYNTARCCPTRASLLTGLYPHQAGIGWMMSDNGFDGYRGELNQSCRTIAEVLRTAGYRTYMTGKWHVTRNVSPEGSLANWPLQRGFDRFYGTIHGAGSFYDPNSLTRDNAQISPYADPEYQPERYYYTDAISHHACRFIEEHSATSPDAPFFLYVAFTAAHWPMHALPEDIDRYRGHYDGGYDQLRAERLERMKSLGVVAGDTILSPAAENWLRVRNREWELRCMEVYAAMVDRMDQGIGRIVDSLQNSGCLENTLILYMQDNGGCAETLGRNGDRPGPIPSQPTLARMSETDLQKDMIPRQTRDGFPVMNGPLVMPGGPESYIAYGRGWANVSNTPFREYKHWVHEGGISTPLIAHWPAGINVQGQLNHSPAHLIDVMATCVDLAQASYPQSIGNQEITPLEGTSLQPAFDGREIPERLLFWEHEGNRAVRKGQWKLVAKGQTGPWELYDIATDRMESRDLASQHSEMAAELAKAWQAWAERSNVLPLVPWENSADNEPQKGRFQWNGEVDIPARRSPKIAGRGFRVSVELRGSPGQGVLIAQGGSSHGFAVSLIDGEVVFAVRRGGDLSEVRAKLLESTSKIVCELDMDGTVLISDQDHLLVEGTVSHIVTQHPQDGLQTGRDLNGFVGSDQRFNQYTGTLGEVIVEIK